MKTLLGIVTLLGSLFTSMLTNDPRWFLVGYPTAMFLVGYSDTNRSRGRVAMTISGLMFFTLIIAIIVKRAA